MRRQKIIITICFLVTLLVFAGCLLFAVFSEQESGQGIQPAGAVPSLENQPVSGKEEINTGFKVPEPGSYDSADTAVIVKLDTEEKKITLKNMEVGKQYTLNIEGTTTLYDKYGEGLSLEQFEAGDVVDVAFLKSKKRLSSMQLSGQAWTQDATDNYKLDAGRSEVTIGEDIYKVPKGTLFFSGSRQIELMDLNPVDELSFQGVGSQVYSITVEKGHGYLRLDNDESFIGGWMEIGQSRFERITEDMLLTVPEGSYEIGISHNGGGGTKNVIINRNEETALDIGDLAVPEVKTGMVLFSLHPTNTELYVDGSEVDAAQPVTLEYGIHQIIAKADGYKSLTNYIRVSQESAGIDVTLDAVDSEQDEEENQEDTDEDDSDKDDSDENDTVTSYYKVYVDAPSGVEVYLDGNYVGISPVNFKKTSGSHIITLRKSGYETRSYTIQIDEEEKDLTYSFADLEKPEEEDSSEESTEDASEESEETEESSEAEKEEEDE